MFLALVVLVSKIACIDCQLELLTQRTLECDYPVIIIIIIIIIIILLLFN